MIDQSSPELLKRITFIPGVMGGRPTIRGLRFKVSDVLGYLSSGMTANELLQDFPYLEPEDIAAALLYASIKLDHPIIAIQLDAA